MSLARPTTQAGHRAALHPRLRAALDRAIEAELAATGVRVTYYSTRRPQLDCSTVAGPCSGRSKHSLPVAEAADMGGRPKADAAFWRRFAARIDDPAIEAGVRYGDNNHFELRTGGGPLPGLDRRTLALALLGGAVVVGLVLS